MQKLLSVFLVMAGMIFLSSCCGCRGAKSTNPHFLTGNSWKLVELYGVQEIAVDNNELFTITFEPAEHKVSGVAACNRYFGTYSEADVRKLTLGQMGTTRMMCRNMQQESEFLKMLGEVDSYTIDGDMLILQKDGEVISIFQALPAGVNNAE